MGEECHDSVIVNLGKSIWCAEEALVAEASEDMLECYGALAKIIISERFYLRFVVFLC